LPQKDNERVLDNAGKAMKKIIAVWHALSKKPSFLFVVAIFDFVLRSY